MFIYLERIESLKLIARLYVYFTGYYCFCLVNFFLLLLLLFYCLNSPLSGLQTGVRRGPARHELEIGVEQCGERRQLRCRQEEVGT